MNKVQQYAAYVVIACGVILAGAKTFVYFHGSPPSITLPATVKGDVGDPIQVDAVTNGKNIKWCSRSVYLKMIPNGTTGVWAIGKVEGSYELEAWTALGDMPSEKATCRVIIGNPPPPIPVPPGPGPVPPVDPFLSNLQAAYVAEATANKAVYMERLVEVYAVSAGPGGVVYDQTVKMTADLNKMMQDAISNPVLLGNNLLGVRQVVQAELDRQLGTASVVLDQPKRDQIAGQYKLVSDALAKVLNPAPPIPSAFRCVLVPSTTMTAKQQAAMDSDEVRGYLNSKCLGGANGWKRWPADVDATQLPDWAPLWNQAKPKLSGAAVVIIRGSDIQVLPLPEDKAALLALLKTYGG